MATLIDPSLEFFKRVFDGLIFIYIDLETIERINCSERLIIMIMGFSEKIKEGVT